MFFSVPPCFYSRLAFLCVFLPYLVIVLVMCSSELQDNFREMCFPFVSIVFEGVQAQKCLILMVKR